MEGSPPGNSGSPLGDNHVAEGAQVQDSWMMIVVDEMEEEEQHPQSLSLADHNAAIPRIRDRV